ncbi:MAG: hypothetical protein U5K36_00285 [Roseovarius sp.]|nr:hypothetical protein [Roseovarius sp.]
MMRLVSMLMTGALLAACSVAQGQQVVARLGADPVLSGGSYSTGGGITVAVDVRERQGKTMVCGVWAQSAQQSILTKGKAKGVLDTGAVSLGGETLVRGLRFMEEVPPMAAYGGQKAGCAVVSRPWQPGDAARRAEIHLPRQVVEVDGDEEGGTIVVRFKPTGPGAGGE